MSHGPARGGWRLGLLVLGAALLFGSFTALGTWQVQRLAWKRDLIARVDARVHADPMAAPTPAQWPEVQADGAAYEYLRVRLEGRFLHQQEALVQANTRFGPGFWVLTPLQLDDGSLVLVNRGFVPPTAREPASRGAAPPAGRVGLQGLLRLSEPGGGFLRRNDPAAGRWYSRDVAAIAAARGLPADRVAPYFVDADAQATIGAGGGVPPQRWPAGGLTVLRFSDNHLVYAITWYALALMTAAAAIRLVRGPDRRSD